MDAKCLRLDSYYSCSASRLSCATTCFIADEDNDVIAPGRGPEGSVIGSGTSLATSSEDETSPEDEDSVIGSGRGPEGDSFSAAGFGDGAAGGQGCDRFCATGCGGGPCGGQVSQGGRNCNAPKFGGAGAVPAGIAGEQSVNPGGGPPRGGPEPSEGGEP